MGNTCTPMVDSCQHMAKPLQYCKVISLQLKYINFYLKKEKEKTLLSGKIEGRRRRGRQSLDGIINSMDMSLRKLREMVKDKEDRLTAVHEVTKSLIRLSDRTTKTKDREYPGEFQRRKIRRELT